MNPTKERSKRYVEQGRKEMLALALAWGSCQLVGAAITDEEDEALNRRYDQLLVTHGRQECEDLMRMAIDYALKALHVR